MALKRGKPGGGEPLEEMEGTVERVTFHSEESGFCVLRVKVKGVRTLETVIGSTPNVVPGETIQAKGAWIEDRDHGRQFKSETLETTPPNSLEGIEKFLGSGLVKGIGPVYAKKLVDKFGEEIFEIIDNRSALLEKVEGIGAKRRLLIKNSWQEARGIRAIMSFLMQHKVSTARAFRIFKTYGDEAIKVVEENPYRLAQDIRGIGFQSADQIASSLGIAHDSDVRARAGVEYALGEFTQQGHCACPRIDLVAKAVSILGIDETIIEKAIDFGVLEARLAIEVDPEHGELVYLMTLYNAEVQLASRLRTLREGKHPCPDFNIETALTWVQDSIGIELAENQARAVATAVRSKVMVITGGPGVGKTTIINAIIKILSAKKLKLLLCAPTGRAAKRMTEATGHEAKTIHRLLNYEPAEGGFKHDENTPLEGDVVIVDEASMLDLPLAWSLSRAVPPHGSLILVGDVDQLPSVGPGSVLNDLIESDAFPVARLNEVFRQAAQSAIVTNAHRIHAGQYPETGTPEKPSDFYIVEAEDAGEAAERLVGLVRKALPEKFGLDPFDDIQVLTPMQRGQLGAQNLNAMMQQSLNPSKERLERFGFTFAVGDKVMQTSNNYDKEVFNGDIGRVQKLDQVERELVVVYGEKRVSYDFNELDELLPSYAITIHKSQGSEYPCVVIPVHTQHYMMLQRNLIYTAITRGKKLVVLVGSKKAIFMAIKNSDAGQRFTTLERRLK